MFLEDFGDEWVTKYMFHYRWHFKDDIENAGNILPLLHSVNIDKKSHKDFKKGRISSPTFNFLGSMVSLKFEPRPPAWISNLISID